MWKILLEVIKEDFREEKDKQARNGRMNRSFLGRQTEVEQVK